MLAYQRPRGMKPEKIHGSCAWSGMWRQSNRCQSIPSSFLQSKMYVERFPVRYG
jgi:hypothetical protein